MLPMEMDPVVIGQKRCRCNTDTMSPPLSSLSDDVDVAHGPLASVQVHGMLQAVSGD